MNIIVTCFGSKNYYRTEVLDFKDRYYPEPIYTRESRGRSGFQSRFKTDCPDYVWIVDIFKQVEDSMEKPEAWILDIKETEDASHSISLFYPYGSIHAEGIMRADLIYSVDPRVKQVWNDAIDFISDYGVRND